MSSKFNVISGRLPASGESQSSVLSGALGILTSLFQLLLLLLHSLLRASSTFTRTHTLTHHPLNSLFSSFFYLYPLLLLLLTRFRSCKADDKLLKAHSHTFPFFLFRSGHSLSAVDAKEETAVHACLALTRLLCLSIFSWKHRVHLPYSSTFSATSAPKWTIARAPTRHFEWSISRSVPREETL